MYVGTYVDILGRVMAYLGILAVGIRTPCRLFAGIWTPWGYADKVYT
jgi:hypothetical protein